ncbi:MAG TPA: hypothetical protein VGM91_01865 [Conexibacter sp.]|jgi:hypothetical protein
MTLGPRPAPGEQPCHSCGAPLAADQRYCVICGARRAGVGAGPAALLFGAAASSPALLSPAPPTSGAPAPALPVTPRRRRAALPVTPRRRRAALPVTPRRRSAALPVTPRRRRAALPVALATLVGLVVVTGTNVPASLAGFNLPPFTVVLPPQVAAQASAPVAPVDTAPPVTDHVAPTPVDDTPLADAPLDASSTDTQPASTDDSGMTPTDSGDDNSGDQAPADDESPIRHVFLIQLGSTDVTALASDEAQAPYLTDTLKPSGTLLSNFTTVGRGALANRIALVSGQGPTQQTLADCTAYGDVTPANALPDGQTGGEGCVYGFESGTLGDQLRALELTWKAYIEPGSATDTTTSCRADASTTRRNPFLWFHGELEAPDCDKLNVPLSQLRRDLEDAETTPALSYIASDAQLGSADADAFLRRVVPDILNSLAFANGGLVVITSDQPAPPAPPVTPPAPSATPVPPSTTTTPAPPATTPEAPPATTPVEPPATTPTEPPATTPDDPTTTPTTPIDPPATTPEDPPTTTPTTPADPTTTSTAPAVPSAGATDAAAGLVASAAMVGLGDAAADAGTAADDAAAAPSTTTAPDDAGADPSTTTAPNAADADPSTTTAPDAADALPTPELAPGPKRYANVGDALEAGAGRRVGALLISPYTPSGSVDRTPADAFTLLATLSKAFGVDPLGYAGARGVEPLPDRLFSQTP